MENNDLDMPTNTYAISQFPAEPVVAMAYVPYRNPSVIYSVEQGIQRGTLFPCLDKPFQGCGGTKK